MLPDIGGSELLVIAAVALIVVGPKDLPILMRKIGQFLAKMRGMASEFRASFDEMARQSELDELRKEVQAMRSGQYTQPFKDAAEAARDVGLTETFAEIDASLASGTMQPYPGAAAPLSPPPEPELIEAPKPRAVKPRALAKSAPKPTVEIKAKAVKAAASAAPKRASAKAVAKAAPARSAKASTEITAPKRPRAPVKTSDNAS
ncbi:Sec-independent protein translocase protein TatB [Caulobacter sp. DWR2-3-1b2]|uniref:Sec-independent protein translocase protein TatB n=1 Tax=unclassified Caulobacter TaxID=2648921 RepID=UPI003CF3B74D